MDEDEDVVDSSWSIPPPLPARSAPPAASEPALPASESALSPSRAALSASRSAPLSGQPWSGTALPASRSAPRSGQPWSDAEYQQILDAARAGERDIGAIARQLGRAPNPTMAKAKQLLPLAQRGVPFDRVLPLLSEYQEKPDYDWRQVMLEQPPPRPIVNPPALTGLRGVGREDLLLLGYAVGVAADALTEDLVTRMGDELERRGLLTDVERYRTERLLRRPGSELTWSEATTEARLWLRRAFPQEDRRSWHWNEYDWEPL